MSKSPRTFTVKQAAKYLGVCRQRVQQFCYEERIGRRHGATGWIFFEDELEEFASIPREHGKKLSVT